MERHLTPEEVRAENMAAWVHTMATLPEARSRPPLASLASLASLAPAAQATVTTALPAPSIPTATQEQQVIMPAIIVQRSKRPRKPIVITPAPAPAPTTAPAEVPQDVPQAPVTTSDAQTPSPTLPKASAPQASTVNVATYTARAPHPLSRLHDDAGRRLENMRWSRRITQRELAKASGVSERRIRDIEYGCRPTDVELLVFVQAINALKPYDAQITVELFTPMALTRKEA